MARIKPKSFINRIASVPNIKNGFRLNSPPTAAVYDPAAAAGAAAAAAAAVNYNAPAQRFVYTANGAPITTAAVPYSTQVLIVSCAIKILILQSINSLCFLFTALSAAAVLYGSDAGALATD